MESLARVEQLVNQQLTSVESFEQAAVLACEALRNSEQVVDQLASSVNFMSVQAGMAADAANRTLDEASAHQLAAIEMSSLIKDLEIIAAETTGVTSKFRLGPLRERLVATSDSFSNIKITLPAPETIVTVKDALADLIKQFADEQSGLFALRENMFTEGRAARSPYRRANR